MGDRWFDSALLNHGVEDIRQLHSASLLAVAVIYAAFCGTLFMGSRKNTRITVRCYQAEGLLFLLSFMNTYGLCNYIQRFGKDYTSHVKRRLMILITFTETIISLSDLALSIYVSMNTSKGGLVYLSIAAWMKFIISFTRLWVILSFYFHSLSDQGVLPSRFPHEGASPV
jgi:hypothetical protein